MSDGTLDDVIQTPHYHPASYRHEAAAVPHRCPVCAHLLDGRRCGACDAEPAADWGDWLRGAA